MAQTSLQAAYDAKTKADTESKDAQAKVGDLQSQLLNAQQDAQAKADALKAADVTLEGGAAAVPQNKLVKTGDGKYLVAFGGQFHVYDEVDASAVMFDDGTGTTPTPEPAPEPTPAPVVDPNAPPVDPNAPVPPVVDPNAPVVDPNSPVESGPGFSPAV